MTQILGAFLLAALLLTSAGSFLTGLLAVGPDAGASLDTRCGIDPDGRCEPGF